MFNLRSIHRNSFLIANQGTCEKQESFLLLLQGHLYDVLGKKPQLRPKVVQYTC
jgi:hypothetical protein